MYHNGTPIGTTVVGRSPRWPSVYPRTPPRLESGVSHMGSMDILIFQRHELPRMLHRVGTDAID